jgi:NRPS condensation-like uncharacterized protein
MGTTPVPLHDAQAWLKLDNAAKIYPAAGKKATPPVFRISVTLNHPVRVSTLASSLRRLIDRTPYYQMFIRRGFFWYFLERHNEYPSVEPMPDEPISEISLRKGTQQLIRVFARETTIAIDFSHVLADGYGGMVFTGSLIVDYLKALGHEITVPDYLLDPVAAVSPEEYQDAYQSIYRKESSKAETQRAAYHIGGSPAGDYRVITGEIPVTDALGVARRYGATLTEYIVATKMHAIQQIHDEQQKSRIPPKNSIVRIEVPVNMRKPFPSKTMRNFSLFVAPEIDLGLGDYSFEEIVKRVHHQMNIQVERNQLLRQIARNVGGEKSRLVRLIPRGIKYAYLSHLRRTIGNRTHSGVVSNLGRFALPAEAEEQIERVGFYLGANDAYKVACSVVSFKQSLYVTIGSVLENRALERVFFRRFAEDGLRVTVSER